MNGVTLAVCVRRYQQRLACTATASTRRVYVRIRDAGVRRLAYARAGVRAVGSRSEKDVKTNTVRFSDCVRVPGVSADEASLYKYDVGQRV